MMAAGCNCSGLCGGLGCRSELWLKGSNEVTDADVRVYQAAIVELQKGAAYSPRLARERASAIDYLRRRIQERRIH